MGQCSLVPCHELSPRMNDKGLQVPKAFLPLSNLSESFSTLQDDRATPSSSWGPKEKDLSSIIMTFPVLLSSCTKLCQADSEHPKEIFLY